MLNDRQKRFAFEYARCVDGAKAYVAAGYSQNGATEGASRLLADPEIQEAIAEEKALLARVARLTPEWVLAQWMMIASADPSELVCVKQFPCAGCWTELGEYDARMPINPDCKRCGGTGERRTVVADTSTLSPAARRLYAGAKQTKEGIEIKMHDQPGALRNLADYLGMLNKGESKLLGPGGGPLQVLTANVTELSDAQLEALAAGALSQNGGSSEGIPHTLEANPITGLLLADSVSP